MIKFIDKYLVSIVYHSMILFLVFAGWHCALKETSASAQTNIAYSRMQDRLDLVSAKLLKANKTLNWYRRNYNEE